MKSRGVECTPEVASNPANSVEIAIWQWPNLLSLDAPLVAVLWQAAFAKAFDVAIPLAQMLLLASSVWLIYVIDRCLDSRASILQAPRHIFHGKHRRTLLSVWLLVLALSLALAVIALPLEIIQRGCLLASAVVGYLLLVHTGVLRGSKEVLIAVLFSLGVTLAAWQKLPHARGLLLIAAFAILCWANCRGIENWEHKQQGRIRVACFLSAGLASIGLALAPASITPRMLLAIPLLISSLGLWLLDAYSESLPLISLPVLADAALLTPVLFW